MSSYTSMIQMKRIDVTDDLVGSEKQVTWANSIKISTMAKISEILRSLAIRSNKPELAIELENKMIAKAESIKDATWWIDNRYMTENELANTFCK